MSVRWVLLLKYRLFASSQQPFCANQRQFRERHYLYKTVKTAVGIRFMRVELATVQNKNLQLSAFLAEAKAQGEPICSALIKPNGKSISNNQTVYCAKFHPQACKKIK